MNLKEQLARLKKTDPNAIPLKEAFTHRISPEENQARREAVLREFMRATGHSEEDIDAYLRASQDSQQ